MTTSMIAGGTDECTDDHGGNDDGAGNDDDAGDDGDDDDDDDGYDAEDNDDEDYEAGDDDDDEDDDDDGDDDDNDGDVGFVLFCFCSSAFISRNRCGGRMHPSRKPQGAMYEGNIGRRTRSAVTCDEGWTLWIG